MTRYTDQQCVTIDGQDLTYKTRPGNEVMTGLVLEYMPRLLSDAKMSLTKTIAAISAKDWSPQAKEMAKHYFLTKSSGPSSSEVKLIKRVYAAALTGLSGDLSLKIGSRIGTGDTAAHGMVRNHDPKVLPVKSHHNIVRSLQTGKKRARHDIHLSTGALIGNLSIITIIHEATHKFAGTIDYCYFDEETCEKPVGTFDNKSKALINADSYAIFARRCWK